MIKDKLIEKAKLITENERNKVQEDKWALKYHLIPKIGWLNDPNGLSYFKGEYHVFYQYSPLDAEGGLKFWGHYKSKDLVQWEDLGIAIYPDKEFERDGVYSGSAIVEGEELYIFYTGNVKKEGNYDYILEGREQNVVCIKTKDGVKFEEKKVVLTNKDFPGNFTLHVRDPKVWKKDNDYYMVLGARDKENKGHVILYKSKDLYNWKFHSIPAGGEKELGYMWECPDFFSIDGKDVLIISPQGMDADGELYNNIYQSGYMLGKFSVDKKKFDFQKFIELDRGFDFYAPQTFKDNKGRRILIGWMGLPDIIEYNNPTIKNGWQHALTIPRELFIENNKLMQKPVEEMKMLRKNHRFFNIDIRGKMTLKEFTDEVFELMINVKEHYGDFQLSLRGDCNLFYYSKRKIFELSLGKSGFGRKKRSVKLKQLKSIHIFSDTSSLEIFLNSGEEVFTTRFYSENIDKDIKLNCKGSINIDRWSI